MKKFYGAWVEPVFDENNECSDGDYWRQYGSLEDAVSENPGLPIYLMTPKRLGKFRSETVVVKIKEIKKAKKRLGKK